ncbi:MAG: CopG family transcriptional regulator [Pseudomonadota bacterium]
MQATLTRATVYLDPAVHQALRLKAASTHKSISDLVSAALRQALKEDFDDLAAFDERKHEKSLSYEELLKKLKANGDL